MATETVIENASTGNKTTATNYDLLGFLERTFERYGEEEAHGNPVTLSAPEWWGLSRMIGIVMGGLDSGENL